MTTLRSSSLPMPVREKRHDGRMAEIDGGGAGGSRAQSKDRDESDGQEARHVNTPGQPVASCTPLGAGPKNRSSMDRCSKESGERLLKVAPTVARARALVVPMPPSIDNPDGSRMVCSRCGSSAPPRDGVCVVCGAPLGPEAARASGGQTPRPPTGPITGAIAGPASGAGTGPISHPPEGETQLGMTPVPPASGSGGEGAGKMTGQGFLSPGHDFGSRYHIIRLLGVGGMGAVYQAWDQTLEVAVAIKVIRPQATAPIRRPRRPLERRFKRELLLARQVTHKNVVRIHDLGEIDGITYITMPYVQGSDLASILSREGRLPVDRALAIAQQIGAGLAAAHEAGVVHRDLKPANIMVDADDDALIMDFGIARSRRSAGMTMTVRRGRRHDRVHGAGAGARRGRSISARTSTRSG